MTPRVWLNDRLVPSAEAVIAADDRGFTLADGCFDTALAINGCVFLGDRHIDRLAATCRALSLPVDRDKLETAQRALAGEVGNGSIRLTVTRGGGARGLALPADPKPTLYGSTAPLAPGLMFKPLRLAMAQTRRNETSLTARHKTLAYLDAIIETDRARANGADEPLFLNGKDRITCSALANIFMLRDHNFVTPPLEDGTIDGVMRRLLVEKTGDVTVDPIEAGEAAQNRFFLTNSLRLLAPASVGEPAGWSPSGATRIHALMAFICAEIRSACGTDPRDLGAEFPTLSP